MNNQFSLEKWLEIDEARARLEAWRSKFQPYPPYPKEATEEPPVTIKPLEIRLILDKKALELQNRIASLEEWRQLLLDKKGSKRKQPF